MITEDKLKHSIAVARKCEQLAKEKGLLEYDIRASFIMGFLHDIGYETADSASKHPAESCYYIDALVDHYKGCYNAIKNHGHVASDKVTVYDTILNTADLTVNHLGEEVTVVERLNSIKEHYGEDSSQYKNSLETARFYGLV